MTIAEAAELWIEALRYMRRKIDEELED